MNATPPRTLLVLALALALSPALAQDHEFAVDSRPTGAHVFVNGAEAGTTPFKYHYGNLIPEDLTLELRSEGLVSRTVDLTMILKNSHAARRPLLVNLYRAYPSDLSKVDLPVAATVNDTKGGDGRVIYGTLNRRQLDGRSPEVADLTYPEQLSVRVRNSLRNTFATATTVRMGTQRGDEIVRQAKVYVQPVIKEFHLDLDEFDHLVYGQAGLVVEWRFFSGIDTDSLLFTNTTSTTYMAFEERSTEVLANAVEEATHAMIDQEGLRERLLKVYSDGLVRSKGSTVELIRPTPITFNGRKDMLASLVKGVVTIKTADGHGSGFLIANDGYILTNAHVVQDRSQVSVRFNQGFTLDGQVVKVNRDFDLALVKTPGSDMPSLELGNDSTLLLGEELFAIGTPLDEQLGQTVTRGIMSGRREFEDRSFIQTDVPINPGNSGGPLIDENGKVVGITTLKAGGGAQGIGFAVPISSALDMLNITFVGR